MYTANIRGLRRKNGDPSLVEPFDWNKFLNDCINKKLKPSDISNIDEVVAIACSWVTCACGNLCDKIPRTNGVPDDLILSRLGATFPGPIIDGRWKSAMEILGNIEIRSQSIHNNTSCPE